MKSLNKTDPSVLWRVIFFERRGKRIFVDRTAPWHPQEAQALAWAQWFLSLGQNVALESQFGELRRLCAGLPS